MGDSMTKRKANPQPHRFPPGHTINAKPEGTQLVGISVTIDPEQLTWLDTQPDNRSATVRAAIDLLISSRDGQKGTDK